MPRDIAYIDEVKPIAHSDLPRPLQGGNRGWGKVGHLISGEETGEMNRDICAQILLDPLGHRIYLLLTVV